MRYSGKVLRGQGRGKALGFPTANIGLRDPSVSGIYAAAVVAGGATYQAAAYADPKRKLLEVHILDFSGDLYGKQITIELLKKIREDEKFSDDVALRFAIAADIATVRRCFQS